MFAIGGSAAGIGVSWPATTPGMSPRNLASSLLIFAFIITVIGGLGSLTGAAIASILVAVLQQFANYYLGGTGDIIVVVLLAAVLLVRPAGLLGGHRDGHRLHQPPRAWTAHPGSRPCRR